MNTIISKVKEVITSVLPIIVLVLLLNFTIAPIESDLLIRFIIGSFFLIIGLTIFLIGVDIGVTPLGDLTGSSFAKSNKLWIVLIGGLIVGFFVSVAEPGLLVLANQVGLVTSGEISSLTIVLIVSIGLAILLAMGFLRILYNIPLYKFLMAAYLLIFILAIFTSRELLAISFDASGATTGILAVPFILSLSMGISKLKKDSEQSEDDSFGLVAISSSGAIIAVMLLDIFSNVNNFTGELELDMGVANSILEPFIKNIPAYLLESFISILPLLGILLVLQKISFKLKSREFRKILTGFIFSFIGLFFFLLGVNGGFMDIGISIGSHLVLLDNKLVIIIVGFVIGLVTILAEPAVYVLTTQIEDVTSGSIKRIAILIPLAIGVGVAVALSVIRLLNPNIHLWHYLLPGYVVAILLMFLIPKLFVGIAFDAGGVATGPMTATFILAFIQGATNAYEGADLLADGFGMIAMVAMIPIITLEFLGLSYAIKLKKKGDDKFDKQPK